ncbi:MAG: tetratricopeptide repeat protein [Planctomycetota bacterium]
MAGKFNTKFVLILASVLIVLSVGGAALVFNVTKKSAAELEAAGDNYLIRAQNAEVDVASEPEVLAQAQKDRGRNYRFAAESYGKAWQREPQNVDLLLKYIEARSNMTVSDQFEAQKILGEIKGLTRQTTELRPDDEQMLEDFYQLLYRWAREFNASSFYTELFALASTRLETDPQNLPAIKFRGIAQAVQLSDAIDRTQQQQIREDLETVLAQRPEDTDALHFLARWHVYDANRTESTNPGSENAQRSRDAAAELAERALAAAPNDPQVQVEYFNVMLSLIDHKRQAINRATSDESRIAAAQNYREAYRSITPVLDRLEATLLETPEPPLVVQQVAELLPRVEKQATTIDLLIEGKSFEEIRDADQTTDHLDRTERLLRRAAETRPDMLLYRLMLANILKLQLELDDAHEIYLLARDHPVAGTFEVSLRDQALRQQAVYEVANIELIRAEAETDPEKRTQLLADADIAVDELEKVSDKDARVLMLRGKLAMLRGQNTQAMVFIDQASGLYQDRNIEALLLSARARQSEKQWGAAAERLEAVLELINNGGREDLRSGIRLQYAEMLIRTREFAAARRQLDTVFETEPGNKVASRLLAEWYSAQQQYDKAIEVLESLPNRDEPAVKQSLARLYGSAGQTGRQRDILLAEFEQNPANPLLLQRVLPLLETEEQKYAALDRAQAAGANPSAIGVLRTQIDSIANQQAVSLDELISQIDKGQGSEADLAIRKSQVYLRANDIDKTREFLEIARASEPDSDRILVLSFDVEVRDGNFDAAHRLADTAGNRDLDLAQGNFLKGQLAAAEGKIEEALSFYSQALEIRPVFDEGWRQYGDLLLKANDPNEAVSAFGTALNQKPDNVRALLGLANAQNALGRHSQALESLSKAVDYQPNDTNLLNRYVAYEQQYGNPDTALQIREEIAESQPENLQNIISLALLKAQEDQHNEALALLDRLEERQGPSLRIAGTRASILQLADQPEAGTKAITEYLDSRGDEATATDYLVLARYHFTGRRANDAFAAYQQAIEREEPGTRLASRELADIFFSSGRLEQAQQIYQNLYAEAEADQKLILGSRLAEALLRQQATDQALELLDELEVNATTEALRSMAAMQRGDREAAIAFVNASLAQNDRNPITYLQRAALLADDPETVRLALEDLREALSINPQSIQAYSAQARIYNQLGQNDEAIRALRSLLEIAPGNVGARSQLAQLYFNQSRTDLAEDLIDEGLESDPDNPGLLQAGANIASALGQGSTAVDRLERLMEVSPNAQTLAALTSLYLQQNRAADAQALLDQRPEAINASPELQGLRGVVLNALGQTEAAKRVFTLALQRSTSQAQINQVLGSMIGSLGEPEAITLAQSTDDLQNPSWIGVALAAQASARRNYSESLAHIESVRGLVPASDTETLSRLDRLAGIALLESGEHAAARDAYRRVLDVDPNNLEALNNLAFILASKLDDPEAALPLARQAADQVPNNAAVVDTLGWTLYQVGQVDEARTTLQRSIRLNAIPANTLHLGRLFLETGELGRARQTLEQCLELSETAGDTDTADRARNYLKQL